MMSAGRGWDRPPGPNQLSYFFFLAAFFFFATEDITSFFR